jgi:hypothetical protein
MEKRVTSMSGRQFTKEFKEAVEAAFPVFNKTMWVGWVVAKS